MNTSASKSPKFDHGVPWFWPMAAALEMEEAGLGLFKRNLDAAAEIAEIEMSPRPEWATPNSIVIELDTMRLRDFSAGRRKGRRARPRRSALCRPFLDHRRLPQGPEPDRDAAGRRPSARSRHGLERRDAANARFRHRQVPGRDQHRRRRSRRPRQPRRPLPGRLDVGHVCGALSQKGRLARARRLAHRHRCRRWPDQAHGPHAVARLLRGDGRRRRWPPCSANSCSPAGRTCIRASSISASS